MRSPCSATVSRHTQGSHKEETGRALRGKPTASQSPCRERSWPGPSPSNSTNGGQPAARVPVVPPASLVCLSACVADLSSLLSPSCGTTLPAIKGNDLAVYKYYNSPFRAGQTPLSGQRGARVEVYLYPAARCCRIPGGLIRLPAPGMPHTLIRFRAPCICLQYETVALVFAPDLARERPLGFRARRLHPTFFVGVLIRSPRRYPLCPFPKTLRV